MTKITENTSLLLNGLFHVLILFTILSIIYFAIINPLEQKTFDNEIKTSIRSGVKTSFENLDSNIKGELNTLLGKKQDNITFYDKLIESYSVPSEEVKEHNKSVILVCIFSIVFVFITLTGTLFFLKFLGNRDIGIFHILQENLITFVFVGVFEFLFFTQVAFKYVPAPPSLIVNNMLESFKNNL